LADSYQFSERLDLFVADRERIRELERFDAACGGADTDDGKRFVEHG